MSIDSSFVTAVVLAAEDGGGEAVGRVLWGRKRGRGRRNGLGLGKIGDREGVFGLGMGGATETEQKKAAIDESESD